MQSLRDWFSKRSWWTVAAIMAILWAAGMYGIQVAIRPDRAGWGLLAGSLVGGVLFGICMALVFRNLQKKYGGGDTAGAIEKAIKRAVCPRAFSRRSGFLYWSASGVPTVSWRGRVQSSLVFSLRWNCTSASRNPECGSGGWLQPRLFASGSGRRCGLSVADQGSIP